MVKNKIGLKFGTLTIVEEYRNEKGKLRCRCICDCGNECSFVFAKLNNGARKHCVECAFKNKKNGSKKYLENSLYKGYKGLPLTLFNSYVLGAKRRNIKFNVDIKYVYNLYIKQNKKCYFTDIDLFLDKNNCNASLDRIDSKKGYEKRNLAWVYKPINLMKNDFDSEYFIKMCCLIYKHHLKVGDNNKSK